MIHYAALGEERTACDLACAAPSEQEHTVQYHLVERPFPGVADLRNFHTIHEASLDPRRVDCPACLANMPEVPLCECGAPALYGYKTAYHGACGVPGCDHEHNIPAQWCAEHCPDDCRCYQCGKPLLDASDSFCPRCLDGTDVDNGQDGVTEYSDPADVGGSAAY